MPDPFATLAPKPTQNPADPFRTLSPYQGGYQGFSTSKYLKDFTTESNPEQVKAANQGFWGEFGNAVAQSVVGFGTGLGETVGYLGVGALVDKIKGTEQEVGNTWSKFFEGINEEFKKEVVPIYQGDNSGHWHEWFNSNLPSIAESLALMLPAKGISWGLGKLAKTLGGLKAAERIGMITKDVKMLDAVTSAGISRHAENSMEEIETYNRLYEEGISKGLSKQEAQQAAKEGANEVYWKNWPLVMQDIVQFSLANKSFGALSRSKSAEEALKQLTKGTNIRNAFAAIGSEAAEEIYQFGTAEEATREAAINHKIREEDYKTYGDRVMDMVANPDLWTAAFFGGLGGGVFHAVGSAMDARTEKQNQHIDAYQKSIIEKYHALYEKNPISFAKSKDTDNLTIILNGVRSKRADQVQRMFESIKDIDISGLPEEQREEALEAINRADIALADLKVAEQEYNVHNSSPTSINDPKEIEVFKMANRLELKSNQRLAAVLDTEVSKEMGTITSDRKLSSTESLLLEAQVKKMILVNEYKGKKVAEDDIIENNIKELDKAIALHTDTLITNGQTKEAIDKKLSDINKGALAQKISEKWKYDLRIEQNNKDYDAVTSTKGKEKVLKEVEEYKQTKANKDLKKLTDQISIRSTFAELTKLKEAAIALGKQKEFTETYNRIIGYVKNTAPKFNQGMVEKSLTERFTYSPLLKDHEINDITNLLIKHEGLGEQEVTLKYIEDVYAANQGFKLALNEYYRKSEALQDATTEGSIGTQPIVEDGPDTNKDNGASKPQPVTTTAKNKAAWDLQAIQFKFDFTKDDEMARDDKGNLIPETGSIPTKMGARGWRFLNQGNLKPGAVLHYEYDFNDEWNRDHISQYEKMYELVHYVDGNINNKQDNNRFIVGVLASYRENTTYKTPEEKQQLKVLREMLMKAVDAAPFKAGYTTLPYTAKVQRVRGGRYWKDPAPYSNPNDVMKAGDKLTLAIGVKHKKGKGATADYSVKLKTNGSPLEKRLGAVNVEEGKLYGLLEDNDGTIVPYKMYVKKVKEMGPETVNFFVDQIKGFKDFTTEEQKNAFLKDLLDDIYIKKLDYRKGTYYITKHDSIDGKYKAYPVKEEDLATFIGEMMMQIDVKKINSGTYNEEMANAGRITTDLHPHTYFHSTQVIIEPFTQAEVKINITGNVPDNPDAGDVKIFVGEPTTITGAGSTKILLGKKKTALVSTEDKFQLLTSGDPRLFNEPALLGIIHSPAGKFGIKGQGRNNIVWFDTLEAAKDYILGTTVSKGKPSLVDTVEEVSYTPIDLEETTLWFTKNLPQVPVNVVPHLIEMYKKGGAKAWGVFEENAIVLYDKAKKGTDKHEAFHAVFNLFLNEEQQQQVLQEGWTEEELANLFDKYTHQEEALESTLGYNVRVFFKKLWDFIQSIFANDIDVSTLFFRINTGFYANADPGTFKGKRFSPVANPHKVSRNLKLINYSFFQALHEYKAEKKLLDMSDVDTIKHIDKNLETALFRMYEQVYNGFVSAVNDAAAENDIELHTELIDITNNLIQPLPNGKFAKGDYYMMAVRELSKFGINIEANQILSSAAYDSQRDDKQFELEEERITEGWQAEAIYDNGKDSLSFDVRRILRQALSYKPDGEGGYEVDFGEYGFPQFVDFDEMYNYLERHLAGSHDIGTMMDRLDDLQKHKPDVYGIVEKLKESSSLKAQFFTNFAKDYTSFMQAMQKTNKWTDYTGLRNTETLFYIYNANRKNLLQILIDDWYSNLLSSRNQITDKKGNILKDKAEEYLAEFDTIIKRIQKDRLVSLTDNKKLSDILLKFGIDISAETLQKEYTTPKQKPKKGETTPYEGYITFMVGPKSVRTLIETLAAGVNPYEGESAETSSARNIADIVSKNVENLHQDTFINAEGKQVYSYLLPTFLTKKFAEFKESETRNEYLDNWWYKANKWLQDLNAENNAALVDNFQVVLLDALLMENKQNVRYADMIDQELDITDLNMFDNNSNKFNKGTAYAYYRLPILSDSTQAPYVRFKKYTQDEVVDGFYQLALAERDRITAAQATDVKIKYWNSVDKNGIGNHAFEYHFVPVFNDPNTNIANEEAAKSAIRKWLDDEGKLEQARLMANGVMNAEGKLNYGKGKERHKSVSDYTNSNSKQFLKDYFYNKVFANAMLTQLLSVDTAFYKDYDDFQKRNGQVYKFTKMIDTHATWTDRNGKVFTPGTTYNAIYIKDNIIASELANIVYKDLIEKGYTEEYAQRAKRAYLDVNQTDAQTYITVDRYRKIQIGLGEWTQNKEDAYNAIKAGKRDDIYNEIFNPIKPFYYNHELIGSDIMIPIQHKNSEVVLLPSMAKKSKILKQLLDHMNNPKYDVDSALFTSAVKVGEYGATPFENLDGAIIHTMDNKYFGIQQETPDHHIDTENLVGSQMKKLAISDIPEGLHFNVNGKEYTKKQLVDNYHKLIVANVKESYETLLDELGTVVKVQEILLKEVVKRNLGEYYEKALELKNGKFNLPLYHPVHARRFESILNAVVRNRVVKQKINGGSFVLMSNFGFTKELNVVMGKDGGVDYMEIMLPPWTKKWFTKKKDGSGEVDFEALKKSDKDILDLFGYRIPTEHKYSMKKLRVVGFTPEIMGGIALLPAEITTIAGEDFDIDKMYVMMPNFEVTDELTPDAKPGIVRKIQYDLDNIDNDPKTKKKTLDKQQRDNAIIDIISAVWSHPAMSDQVLTPGGFKTLSALAKNSPNRKINEAVTENPIYPRTQMEYFKRNMNGNQLVGVGAIHNVSHATLQYTEIALTEPVKFNGHSFTKLNAAEVKQRNKVVREHLRDVNGIYISRNLAEFIAAFVDNAKDPVAGDLNLNLFTFDVAALIVRLGYDLKTAVDFITQPAIQVYTDEYFRAGGSRAAEQEAFDSVIATLKKDRKFEVKDEVYNINIDTIEHDTTRDLSTLDDATAEEQLKILYSFKKYKRQAESLSKLVRATRNDTLGTRKTIAGNTKAIQDMQKALDDNNLTGVSDLITGDAYPIVSQGAKYGLIDPQREILSRYFPYANAAYHHLYKKLDDNKNRELTEDEINYVNNLSLVYYTSGFEYFNMKEKEAWINTYPRFFLEAKNLLGVEEYKIMKYLKFVPKSTEQDVDKIEFVSGATISNEQRTTLQQSWKAMITSDNPAIAKLGRDLIKYSFHTNGLSFSYGGFSHLIPTDEIDKLVDPLKLNFRDYLYKLMPESEDGALFDHYVDQLFRHDTKKQYSLLPKLPEAAITNKIAQKGVLTSVMVDPKYLNINKSGEVLSEYFKIFDRGRGKFLAYKYSGTTSAMDYIFNVMDPLGEGTNIYEFDSRKSYPQTVIGTNKLPEFDDKAFYNSSPKQEFFQLNSTRDIEIKFGLLDSSGNYKSYGKDGKGESSTKAYRKLIEDVAKINKEIANTGFKAIATKQPDGKGGLNWIARVVDEYHQLSETGLAPDEKLNDLLIEKMADFGVKVEYYNDLKSRLGNSVNAMTNIQLKLIKISKGQEIETTLPEEVGHIAEAYNRGTMAHNRLMELIASTPEYSEVLRDYSEEYENDETKLKQEAIGKIIGNAIIKKNKTTNNNLIYTFVKKLWNDFINIFKKTDENSIRQEIEDITGKIASDVIEGNFEDWNTSTEIKGKFYQLSTKIEDKAKKILEDAIDAINKKIKIYGEQGTEKFTANKEKFITALKDEYYKSNYELGLTNYILGAKKELVLIVDEFNKIAGKSYNNIEDRADILNTLSHINDYIRGFAKTLEEIAATNMFAGTEVRTSLAETNDLIKNLEGQYHEIAGPILLDVLKQFNSNPDLDVAKAIATLEKDISWTQRWLDAMAECSAPILQILDIIVKDGKQNARVKTLDFRQEILKRQLDLEKAGIPSTSFTAERDWSGAITGRYVTKYNIGEFKKQEQHFWKTLEAKYPDVDKLSKSDKRKRGAEIRKWYDENTQEREDKKAFIESKRAEFKNKYAPLVAEEKFNEWKNKNTNVNEYLHEEESRGELLQPANKFLSTQYQDIQKSTPMKEYLNFIVNHIESNDQRVEERFRLNGFLPQLKKDFQDRLFVYDKDGKKRVRDVKDVGREIKGSIIDTFKIHENDTEFGITDEEGKPVNLIPLNFTRRLGDPNQMSLDITSSMTAYMYSFNDYIEMNNIIGILSYTKDALAEQEVLTGTRDFVTLMSNKFTENKKGKPVKYKDITIKGEQSLAYARLEDYMKMNIYGQQNANEQFAKIADLLNRFTSLNSLALNLYTGVSNVLTGNAMIRMEAMAKEFVTLEDYAWANLEYTQLLPQTVRNIGSRLPDDYLSLWNDRMDTFQNYEKDYRDVEADRSTLAGRLIQTSSLYFINHAGEHMLQSRMSMALAHNTKLKDLLGNELTVWEAFEIVDGKLKLKEGLKKVGGTSATSLFTKAEDGQDLTERDINRFINRQNSVNKSLNGIYNNIDKAAAQQFALFRLGVMFRKYIKPGWNRRFQKRAWNYEAEIYREGYYTTAWNFLKLMRKEIKEGQFSLVKNWQNLTPAEKANFRRLATEWTYVIAAATLFTVLSNLADDDDDNALLAFSAYEAARLYSEMRFFTSINEAQRILRSPAASVNQVEKLLKFMEVWNYGDEIKAGKFKGYTVIERNLIKTVPMVGTFYNFRTPEEQLKYYSNNGLSIY